MKQTILAISGKPGLYKLVSRAKNSLIVEALDGTGKRIPAFGTDRITSLADIAMFTETEDVPLMKILASLRDLEKEKVSSLDYKKASAKELHDYFSKVLPDWDQERVQNSHIKKLISGTISLSMPVLPTSKRRWHRQRGTMLMIEVRNEE